MEGLPSSASEPLQVDAVRSSGAGRAVLGLVADTHGYLDERLLRAFEGVDMILHAGDVGGESVLGPYILGLELPVQIAPMTASASDLVTLAVLAAGAAKDRKKPSKSSRPS